MCQTCLAGTPFTNAADQFPLIFSDELCSPVHRLASESRIGPPTSNQIVQSKLLHRRVKLNVGGVRWIFDDTC